MLWVYECARQTLRVETTYDHTASEYVVVVHYPDGRQQTERFAKSADLRDWLLVFELSLDAAQWVRRGPTIFVTDGGAGDRVM